MGSSKARSPHALPNLLCGNAEEPRSQPRWIAQLGRPSPESCPGLLNCIAGEF